MTTSTPGWQPVRRYAPSLDSGRAACALGAIGLATCLAAFSWFGAVGPSRGLERTGRQLSVGGWSTLTVTRWVLVTLCAAGLLAALLGRRSSRGHPGPPALLAAVAAAGAVIAGYRVLVHPPEAGRIVDVKLGGYLAVLCAATVAIGAAEVWRRTRENRRALGA